MQEVCKCAISISRVDFSLVSGYRPPYVQMNLFKKGRVLRNGIWRIREKRKVVTSKDGYKKKSRHNAKPSQAFDFCGYVEGKPGLAYDEKYLCYLGGLFCSVGSMLYFSGRIKHQITWGGNWDNDGEIITDQTFQDLCHCQLKK